MKRIKNIFLILIFFVLILFIKNKVEAVSISSSPSNPKKGQAVTITVTVPNVNTVDLTATISGAGTSGTIKLVDGSMTGDAKTFSKSITVTPTSTGTIKVSISSSSNAVLNGNYVNNLAISKSITVSEPESSSGGNGSGSGSSSSKPPTTTKPPVEVKKSTDNTLSALSIEGGQISPEFNKDVKEYALKVPYEVVELNVTAKPNDSKAKVEVIGNKDLQEGENILTVRVTAEDGSVADYVVKVTRARIPLALKSLVIKYENENREIVETPLNPVFSFDIFEYSLEELEYWVEKLSVEAIPNIEGANIDVQGADSLQAGENTITITAKISAEVAEGEEPKEEIITYTIKVNKKQEPTTMEKLSNWYNQNEKYVIIGALGVCIVFLFGLSIYIVVDYNKYKHVVKKVKEANDFKSNNIFEETSDEITEEEKDTAKTGKRFK